MNNKQVAFITCVSDKRKYAECRYYLDRLRIPEGYSIDVINIQEASSMTAGYNAGMKSSDAKYKVYLHQDVFIRNVNFLSDLLAVFACDEQIGLLGMRHSMILHGAKMFLTAGIFTIFHNVWNSEKQGIK